MKNVVDFSVLQGKTLASIFGGVGEDKMIFTCTTGESYEMYHDQDCCENVYIVDITGVVASVIGSTILLAEESTNSDGEDLDKYGDSWTWTFYKLATLTGHLTIRWYGSSNGYYSESVIFEQVI